MIWLPDGNVLIALMIKNHAAHLRSTRWLGALSESLATCSVSQGTLVRLHMHLAQDQSSGAAWRALAEIEAHPQHVYWDGDLPYREVPHRQIQGHRQVTDAWLIELARRNSGKVATLDQGMAATYPNEAVLI